MRTRLLIPVGLLALGLVLAPAPAQGEAGRRLSLRFEGADIHQVIKVIAKVSGANLTVAPEVQGSVTLYLNDVHWRDALDAAIKSIGCRVIEEDSGVNRRALPLIIGPLLLSAGCTIDTPAVADAPAPDGAWTDVVDSTSFRILVESPTLCEDCVAFERVVVLGDTVGPGYTEASDLVLRDRLGRYWVGQRDFLKVYDESGWAGS